MFNARFYSLWAINDALELDCLRRRLDELKRLGFDGVVFPPGQGKAIEQEGAGEGDYQRVVAGVAAGALSSRGVAYLI